MTEEELSRKAPVFNIQSYSIHDGPGIRVTVFLKGCPLRCLWCANPESNSPVPQLMTYNTKCTGCGACVKACPQKAVRLTEIDGAVKQETNRSLCVNCASCVPVCPADARELAGKEMTVRDVLDRVLQDKLFLDASGGGMTISGGEFLAHPAFSEALLRAAQEAELHTAVESCSFAPRETIDRVFPYVNLGLLDVKHMDPAKHREYTGVSNELILDNIRHIYRDLHVPVIVRVPVIPGHNDDDENIAATARFASDLGPDAAVHLLPYHRLGDSKLESLGETPRLHLEIPSDEHMQHLKALTESFGVQAQIGG